MKPLLDRSLIVVSRKQNELLCQITPNWSHSILLTLTLEEEFCDGYFSELVTKMPSELFLVRPLPLGTSFCIFDGVDKSRALARCRSGGDLSVIRLLFIIPCVSRLVG